MRFMMTTIAIVCACSSVPAVAESLGEHPAVLVKRHAIHVSQEAPYMKFYMHPAGLQLLAGAPDAPVPAKSAQVAARPHTQIAN